MAIGSTFMGSVMQKDSREGCDVRFFMVVGDSEAVLFAPCACFFICCDVAVWGPVLVN